MLNVVTPSVMAPLGRLCKVWQPGNLFADRFRRVANSALVVLGHTVVDGLNVDVTKRFVFATDGGSNKLRLLASWKTSSG
jgi:hypothetical protein